MGERYFKEEEVDWEHIPSLASLEAHIGAILGSSELEARPSIRLRRQRRFSFGPEEYVPHKGKNKNQIISMYEENGFETKRVVQDPFGHRCPTVACPIGFPFNLPLASPKLRRFNRWICRVHVDIVDRGDCLVSAPHIEPDPRFQPLDHFWDTYIKKHVIRGKEAVAVLNFLGIR
jgi:hypothetical protein